jgi:hypothetical protein
VIKGAKNMSVYNDWIGCTIIAKIGDSGEEVSAKILSVKEAGRNPEDGYVLLLEGGYRINTNSLGLYRIEGLEERITDEGGPPEANDYSARQYCRQRRRIGERIVTGKPNKGIHCPWVIRCPR